jgi:hypothetical protein
MHLVLASKLDSQASELVEKWKGCGVALVTPEDFCSEGWRLEVAPRPLASAVVGGQIIDASEIQSVLTLLPVVYPIELRCIVEEDRAYVASEITAFLMAWLALLPGRVFNPPLPPSLSGPTWGLVRWREFAKNLGVSVADSASARETSCVTVLCKGALGTDDSKVKDEALKLANAAGISVGSFRFAGSDFYAASTRPDLSSESVVASFHLLWKV